MVIDFDPYSEPCKALAKKLGKAQDTLMPWASVLSFDCEDAPNFCASQRIVSYPTVRIFHGQDQSRYRGKFTATASETSVIKPFSG